MRIIESEKKYSQEEGVLLIQLARHTIQNAFSKVVSFSSLQIASEPFFSEKRGVFVSLWLNGTPKGCMGTPWPNKSLRETVQDAAMKAINDKRYPPLEMNELPDLQIEVTILTTPQSIEPNQIELGIHGLIIYKEEGSGLLLPHIPLEYGWNIKEFLSATCLKGNLSTDAWKDAGCLYAFEVQIFKSGSSL